MLQRRDEVIGGVSPPTVSLGEMRRRLDALDWTTSPLGPRERWPQSLVLTVYIILASGFPLAVRWGPDLVMIYNDAHAPLLCHKHPRVVDRPVRAAWPEIWDRLAPLH